MRARITKHAWHALGGLANPDCFRKQWGAGWSYWVRLDGAYKARVVEAARRVAVMGDVPPYAVPAELHAALRALRETMPDLDHSAHAESRHWLEADHTKARMFDWLLEQPHSTVSSIFSRFSSPIFRRGEINSAMQQRK